MLNLLSEFANSLIAIIQFVWNTITSLMDFLVHIPTYLNFVIQSISLIPNAIIPFALACIGIYVFLFTVGKD